MLVAIGLVAVAAASPVAAQKLSTTTVSLDPLYYFYRQLMWVMVGVPVMLGVSMLPKPQARRFAIYGTIAFVALLFLVPLIGTAVNGAQRWIGSGVFRLQPSEFLKPFRSEEHTSELQSLMRISYAVFCLNKKQPKLLTSRIDCRLAHEGMNAQSHTC